MKSGRLTEGEPLAQRPEARARRRRLSHASAGEPPDCSSNRRFAFGTARRFAFVSAQRFAFVKTCQAVQSDLGSLSLIVSLSLFPLLPPLYQR
jgi:hypothetical protein